jgi:replicative DNA helicase
MGKDIKELVDFIEGNESKPEVIFIDHIQMVRGASMRNQKEIIDEYLKHLFFLMKKRNLSVVIGSQINRAGREEDNKEPQLHHLKSTGVLEEAADIVLLCYWPWHNTKKGDPNKYCLNVAKNRGSRTGWLDISYTPEFYLFSDAVPKEEKPNKHYQENWEDLS